MFLFLCTYELSKFKVGVKWFLQNTDVSGTWARYVMLVRGYGTLVRGTVRWYVG